MPKYVFEAPDGRKVRIEADNEQEALAGVEQWWNNKGADKSPGQASTGTQSELTAGRAASLAGRAVAEGAIEGVAGLPALAGDAALNAGRLGYNTYQRVTGGTPDAEYGMDFSNKLGEFSSGVSDKLGFAKPESDAEKLAVAAGKGAVSAVTPGGVARGLGMGATKVGRALAAAPVAQAVSGAVGSGASQAAQNAGADPITSAIVGVGSGMAPSLAAGALRRGFVGGSETRAAARGNISKAQELGVELTAGQAAPGSTASRAEGTLAQLPLGRGPIVNARKRGAEALGSSLDEVISGITPNTDPAIAGREVKDAMKGPGGLFERARATQEALYKKFEAVTPRDTPIGTTNIRRVLDEVATPTPSAPNTTETLINPKLAQLREAVLQDLGTSTTLPYEAVAGLREKIGRTLRNSGASAEGIPVGELKQVYGALMSDIRDAFPQNSSQRQFLDQADRYTKMFHEDKKVIDPMIKGQTPEAAFSSVERSARTGGTGLERVLMGAKLDQRERIAASYIDSLGRASKSAQSLDGGAFSPQVFAGNWAALSDKTKEVILKSLNPDAKERLMKILETSQLMKQAGNINPNPSGSGFATIAGHIANVAPAAGVGAVATGAMSPVNAGLSMAALYGIPAVGSRLFTNPAMRDFLMRENIVPVGGLLGGSEAVRD